MRMHLGQMKKSNRIILRQILLLSQVCFLMVVDATVSAMNEGLKQAQRKRIQENFRVSVHAGLGTYWDENHPR